MDNLKELKARLTTAKSLCASSSYELEILAKGFKVTGNEHMSNKLFNITNNLDVIIEIIDEGFSDYLNKEVKESGNALASILKTILEIGENPGRND